jgi:Glu-tRNA(Gln) amidotransferase subunit E-like FAD-binding protein
MGLGPELVAALSLSPSAELFERLAAEKSINVRKAAHICTGLMTGLRRRGYRFAQDSQGKIYQIILSALRHDWPYGRLKEALIALASNEPVSESQVTEPDEAIFEKSWGEAEQAFIPSRNDTDHEKFRRFIIGRLLEKYPAATRQILERVSRKLAVVK